MTENLLFIKLHRLLATLLRKNRFIRKLTHTGLNRAEVHVLIEIQARQETNVKTLQSLLGVDQSSVSRISQKLINDKLIKAIPSKIDKRSKALSLTNKGLKLIEQIDLVAGAMYEGFASRLSGSEGVILLNFFRAIADHNGQPNSPLRTGENEIRLQQRRMSRALGVLSQNIFNSNLSPTQWHVLTEVCSASYPLNPKQISDNNDIPANSLTVILEKLESLGLITKVQASHDSRFLEINITSKGLNFLTKIEITSAKNIENALSAYSDSQLSQLLAVMKKYVGGDTQLGELAIPDAFSIKKIENQTARKKARTFALNELVRRGHAEYAPSKIIFDDSLVFGLFDEENKLLAVAEIFESKKNLDFSLLASNREVSPSLAFAFLDKIIKTLEETYKKPQLTFSFFPASRLMEKAGRLIS